MYKKAQDIWVQKNDVKIGDEVLVVKRIDMHDDNWICYWSNEMMTPTINEKGVVERIENFGIGINFDNEKVQTHCVYHYKSLKKINPIIKEDPIDKREWYLLD